MSDIIEIIDESTIEIVEIIDESGETILVVIEDSKEQNVGVFATLVALQTAYPTGQNGWTATVRPNLSASWVDTAWVITSGEGEANNISNEDAAELTGGGITDLHSHQVIETFIVECSGKDQDIEFGTNIKTFRMQFHGRFLGFASECVIAPTGTGIVIDVNINTVSTLTNKISIDATGVYSKDAAIQPVIDTNNDEFNINDLIGIDFDLVGLTETGKEVKVHFITERL